MPISLIKNKQKSWFENHNYIFKQYFSFCSLVYIIKHNFFSHNNSLSKQKKIEINNNSQSILTFRFVLVLSYATLLYCSTDNVEIIRFSSD